MSKKQKTSGSYLVFQTEPEQKKRLEKKRLKNGLKLTMSVIVCIRISWTKQVRFIHPLSDKHIKRKENMNVAQAVANKQATQAGKSSRSCAK